MISALLEYHFLQNALVAGILASIVCGIIGVIVVEKKLIMLSGGIAHTAYGGVGLGYLLGFEPVLGAFLFSLLSALGIGYISRKGNAKTEILIGLFWPLGMALGILFIAMMDSYPPDMSSYLFGNILSVTKSDLLLMAGLTVVVILSVFIFFNNWKAYLFDQEFASIIGIKTTFLEYFLLALIAMTVVVLIRVVGIILVLALLTAPAAVSAIFFKDLKKRMLASVFIGAFFCIAGLWISYYLNIASGASIVILCVICYFIAYGYNSFKTSAARNKLKSIDSSERR